MKSKEVEQWNKLETKSCVFSLKVAVQKHSLVGLNSMGQSTQPALGQDFNSQATFRRTLILDIDMLFLKAGTALSIVLWERGCGLLWMLPCNRSRSWGVSSASPTESAERSREMKVRL